MPDLSSEGLLAFFSGYAYEPMMVYSLIIIFMVASSFGLPVPEELVLVSAGLIAYMAKDPVSFPPPYPDAVGVDPIVLAMVCFFAVFISDTLVYLIGKFFGAQIIKSEFFKRRTKIGIFETINSWFLKYGGLSCGIFRFTPGLRFPGHLSCGLFGIPLWKFLLIDGAAALISVPTQILFVATYGNIILDKMKEFKLILLLVLGVILFVWILRNLYLKSKLARSK